MNKSLERISINKKLGHPLVTIREHLIRYTLALQNIKDKDVLDIACGTGYGTYLMSYWAKSISGYDKHDSIIKVIKREFQMKAPSFLDVRDLEEKNVDLSNNLTQDFDVITCFETLEHLKNPENLVISIKRYLKPKGVFYFSTPNKKNLKDKNIWHKNAFNKKKLVKLMNQCFKNIESIEFWGQDQWGLSKDFNKPYIIGRVRI